MNSDAKNRPPRKPLASEIRQATSFNARKAASAASGKWPEMSRARAPWPAPSTCGVIVASVATASPPITGRAQTGVRVDWSARSDAPAPRMATTPIATAQAARPNKAG